MNDLLFKSKTAEMQTESPFYEWSESSKSIESAFEIQNSQQPPKEEVSEST